MSSIKLLRRGSAAASAEPVANGLPFYGTWPASSGAWPAPWQTVLVNGGTISQNNGVGRIERTGTGFTAAYPTSVAVADIDIRLRIYPTNLNSNRSITFHTVLRWGLGMGVAGNSHLPASCYGVVMNIWSTSNPYNNFTVYSADANGNQTTLFVSATNLVPDGSTWLRFQAKGNILRFKAWGDASPEPVGWLTEITDSTHTSPGYAAIASGNASDSPVYPYSLQSYALTSPI